MEEIWTILNENDNYSISNKGRIRNKDGIICTPFINNSGYYCIGLWRNNKKKNYCIHKLVAKYYLKEYNDILDVDHIDNNKLNNNINNLQLLRHKDNCIKRSKIVLQALDENNNIIQNFTSYKKAAKYVHINNSNFTNRIVYGEITPIYSKVLNKIIYFKTC